MGGVMLPGHKQGLDHPQLGRLEESVCWKDQKQSRSPGKLADDVSGLHHGLMYFCDLQADDVD